MPGDNNSKLPYNLIFCCLFFNGLYHPCQEVLLSGSFQLVVSKIKPKVNRYYSIFQRTFLCLSGKIIKQTDVMNKVGTEIFGFL